MWKSCQIICCLRLLPSRIPRSVVKKLRNPSLITNIGNTKSGPKDSSDITKIIQGHKLMFRKYSYQICNISKTSLTWMVVKTPSSTTSTIHWAGIMFRMYS